MAELVGYDVAVYVDKIGTSTPVVGGGLTLVSGKTYRVTAVNAIWDPTAAIAIYDNAAPVASTDIEKVDLLYGSVTFASSYSVTGPVTADYSYHPRTTIAAARSASFRAERELLDASRFGTAYRKKVSGLKSASGTIGYVGFIGDSATSQELTDFEAGTEVVIEIHIDSTDTIFAETRRARAIIEGLDPSAAVDGLVEDTLNWQSTSLIHADGWYGSFSFGRVI